MIRKNAIACFDKDINEETVKTIAQLKPLHAVFRDNSFTTDAVATNFDQIFATYSPNTTRKVYPRLRIAKNLLSEDGIIFISIDDNELSNLSSYRQLMDVMNK